MRIRWSGAPSPSITGQFTLAGARELAGMLKSGSLPVRLTEQSVLEVPGG